VFTETQLYLAIAETNLSGILTEVNIL